MQYVRDHGALIAPVVPLWRLSFVLGAAALLGISGCATTQPVEPTAPSPGSGNATWHSVTVPGTKTYELSVGESASGSNLLQEVAPVYPEAMLLRCPPSIEIPALVVVDAQGDVTDVRADGTIEANPARKPFVDAVRTAVNQWHFNPLLISHAAADARGDTHVVDRSAKPFSLSYVFDFSCHGGQGTISRHKSGAAH